MKEIVDRLANSSTVGDTVTIFSSPSSADADALNTLADAVAASVKDDSAAPEAPEEAAGTKWVCKICGYVYEGDEVPEDYKCPICGAGKAAFEEAEHAAKFAELLGEVLTDSTAENLKMRVDAEYGATAGKTDLAKRAKALNLDAIHDTVHEMARDEARHGKALEGLLNRYFKK